MTTCEREDELLDAVQSGRWSAELRAHADSCAACRDLLLVTGALAVAEKHELPSASFLWWKGQIQAQREARERLERPLAMAEWAGLAGAVLALVLLANGAVALMVAAAVAGIALPVAWYWRWSHR